MMSYFTIILHQLPGCVRARISCCAQSAHISLQLPQNTYSQLIINLSYSFSLLLFFLQYTVLTQLRLKETEVEYSCRIYCRQIQGLLSGYGTQDTSEADLVPGSDIPQQTLLALICSHWCPDGQSRPTAPLLTALLFAAQEASTSSALYHTNIPKPGYQTSYQGARKHNWPRVYCTSSQGAKEGTEFLMLRSIFSAI